MLNNLYKINEVIEKPTKNSIVNLPNNDYRTITEYLHVDITYRSNDYLNRDKNARGIWITPTQICFELLAEDKLTIKQILLIKFVLPDNNKIHLKVTVDTLNDNIVVVNHGTYSKYRTDPSSDSLVKFLAAATWKKANKIYHHSDNINTCMAEEYEHFNKATRLLYKEYRIKGYCEKQPSTSYFNYFAILPDSKTFLIRDNSKLLGTFSFIPDSPYGLPSESIYSDEITQLRSQKRKFAELSLLAFDAEEIQGRNNYLLTDPFKMYLFVKLVKSCVEYALQTGVTDLVVATNPIHKRNYQLILFEQLGNIKTYKEACDNPAILLHADLNKLRDKLNALEENSTNSLIQYLYGYKECKYQKINNNIAILLERSCPHIPEEVSNYIQFCYGGRER